MSRAMPGLPTPAVDAVTEPYWTAGRDGVLRIQRCGSCGTHRHPPTAACYACGSLEIDWDDALPGTGTVHSFIWTHRPVTPTFGHLGVYNCAVVELDGTAGEPVRVMSRVDGVDHDTLRVGLEVIVDFDPCDDDADLYLPVFRVAEG